MTDPGIENAARRGSDAALDGAEEKLLNSFDFSTNVHLLAPRRHRPGLVAYRAPRTPGDICAAITNALNRYVRLARHTGVNTPPEVLTDMSEWIGRGCLP